MPALVGRRVLGAWVHDPAFLGEDTPWPARVVGQRIHAVGRRGKFLLVYLEEGVLLLHLGMSGRFVALPAGEVRPRHTRWVLRLEGGWDWAFVDPRGFGRVRWVRHPWKALVHLGPEPLGPFFTPEALARRLAGRRARIKGLLLDQRFVAGVGNIYADEALHRAGLHPAREAGSLTRAEVFRLWTALRDVLREGLRHRGATLDAVYPDGGFQRVLRVYGRAGRPCYTCGAAIRRTVLAGRSAHFCPRCQPLRPKGPSRA